MRIPIVNLKPALEQTRKTWRENRDALMQREFFILGPEPAGFEASPAATLEPRFAIGLRNESTTIEVSLRDLGDVSSKREVIPSKTTAPFTGVSLAATGATPRVADIVPTTLQVEANDLGNRIRKQKYALLPIQRYGNLFEKARA